MKIYFLDSNDQHRQLHRMYLENIFDGSIVYEFNTLRAMERAFAAGRVPDVVICGQKTKDASVGEVYQACQKVLESVPFVYFGSDAPETKIGLEGFYTHHRKNTFLSWPCSPSEFRSKISKALFPERFGSDAVAAFQRVRLINFYRFNQVLCQVYIKLSERKYVRVFHKGVVYSKSELDGLREKGITHLYIRNDDFHMFQHAFKTTPFLTGQQCLSDPNEAMAMTHTLMREIVKELGVTDEVLSMVEESLEFLTSLSLKHDSLRKLFKNFETKNDYFFDHSFLSCSVAIEIMSRMNLNSKEARTDLIFAALMHDGALENPHIARISSLDDKRLEQFTKDEVLDYLRHPLDMADQVSGISEISPRALNLIRQHHEKIDGSGFPHGLAAGQIEELSKIFILAHEFVDRLEAVDYDVGYVGVVLEKMRKIYGLGPLQKIMSAFLDIYERAS